MKKKDWTEELKKTLSGIKKKKEKKSGQNVLCMAYAKVHDLSGIEILTCLYKIYDMYFAIEDIAQLCHITTIWSCVSGRDNQW